MVYYRDKLNIKEKLIYDRILKTCSNYNSIFSIFNKNTVKCGQLTIDNLKKIYNYILFDHPNLYYLSQRVNFKIINSETELELEYIYTTDEIKKLNNNLFIIIEDLKKQLFKIESELEKEEKIIRYIVRNAKYEINNITNQNIIAALCFKKAQCSGFSKAFKYLCDIFNIWCIVVDGVIIQDNIKTNHAWNIIKLNNEYYHVDITSNHGKKDDELLVRVNCSDSIFQENSIWDKNLVPKCSKNININNKESPFLLTFSKIYDIKKHLYDQLNKREKNIKFIVDIDNCSSQDINKLVSNALIEQMKILKITKYNIKVEIIGKEINFLIDY